jgi:hypothetical protein
MTSKNLPRIVMLEVGKNPRSVMEAERKSRKIKILQIKSLKIMSLKIKNWIPILLEGAAARAAATKK